MRISSYSSTLSSLSFMDDFVYAHLHLSYILIIFKICMCFIMVISTFISSNYLRIITLRTFLVFILYDFLVTVKAAPHECVIRTSQPQI